MKRTSPMRLPADFPDVLLKRSGLAAEQAECWAALSSRYRLGSAPPTDMRGWRRLARGLLRDLVPAFKPDARAEPARLAEQYGAELEEFAPYLRHQTIGSMPTDLTPIAQALLSIAVRDCRNQKLAAFDHLVKRGRMKMPARYRSILKASALETAYKKIPKAIRDNPEAALKA